MGENSKLTQAQQILLDYIKMKKMRVTPERTAVLEAAYAVNTPFTIDQLKTYMDDILPVSRATVYNNLELFFKLGLVIKHAIGGGAYEYEACVQTITHHHLVCNVCHQVFEFKDASIEKFFTDKKYRKFRMTNCSVLIYGVCNRCQGKLNREKRKLKQNTK